MKSNLTILVLFAMSILPIRAQQLLDKVVCQVGGEIILLSDIEASLAYIQASYGTVDESAECFVLQDLIAQKLLINQAKLDSVVVTDEEVNNQIDARIERILGAMGNDESRFEAYYGRSVDEVRREQQENLRNTLYVEKMRAKVMTDVVATPSEVTAFFNSIPSDSLPFFNSEVEISEIVFKPSPSESNKTAARTTLEDLRARIIKDSTQFARLASIYSDDPGSKDKAGDLGWQKRGTFVPEFEAVAYNLEEGEYSEIVETEFGFHLIQLLDRRGNLINTRHILIRPEYEENDLVRAEKQLDSIRNLLILDSMTFEYAVRIHGDDKVQSHHNGGRMTNAQTGNTFFEIGELESDVFFAIDGLEIGEFSKPILIDNIGDDPVYKLYRLDSRSAPHQASLEQDYNKIQKSASESKKQRLFNEWLFERVRETHVKIDTRYGCPQLDVWLNQ